MWMESLDYDYEIKSSACVRHKSPRSSCEKCLVACQEGAITLSQGKPVIDNEKCSECGNCLVACPVQAVTGIVPKRTFFQNKLIATNVTPLSPKELLLFHAKGITTIVCEEKAFSQAWKDMLVEVNSLLRKLGKSPFMTETETSFEDSYSRRELFSHWKKEGRSFLQQVTPAKWRFNHLDLDVTRYYPDYQFFDVTIDGDKCTLCKACEVLCPKTCFSLDDLCYTITNQSCSGCQLCLEICPEKAITVTCLIAPAVTKSLSILTKMCSCCKSSFLTLREHDEKCAVCTNRKAGYLTSKTC
jgi:ferredoxin